jgi:CheY-like chemotaxis protein
MPGDELARQLRVLHPRLPIILATGYDMNAFAPMLRDQLVRVLEKPFDEPQLFEQLRSLHQTTV